MVIALEIIHLLPATSNQELVLLICCYDSTLVSCKLQEEIYVPLGTLYLAVLQCVFSRSGKVKSFDMSHITLSIIPLIKSSSACYEILKKPNPPPKKKPTQTTWR